MLTQDFVKAVVTSDIDPRIVYARNMHHRLRLHVDGREDDLQIFLERINNYENERQYEARKKFAISNKYITEDLLRPTDNAFNAKGGSKRYKFSTNQEKLEKELSEKLLDVKHNESLSSYIENVWFHKFIVDPNGLIMLELPSEEDQEYMEDDEIKPDPTYKSIDSIRSYEQDGLGVKYVIFEPHSVRIEADDKDKEIKIFWAVDEEYYYLFEISDDGLAELNRIPHDFGRVPASLCSNLIDNVSDWKRSPIDAQVELLDKYCVTNSVQNISEFFHLYPQQWAYVDDCPVCNGKGEMTDATVCNKCDGTGKRQRKDVTDILELKVPRGDDPEIAPPTGYIDAPIDSLVNINDSNEKTWNKMFFSHWGTSVERKENETATGRFIDVQPVHNRLNKYSTSIEKIHSNIADLFGTYYYPETFEKSHIQYGRRYLVETPDQIWKKYMESKKNNAPVSSLDLLYMQYLESEFRENLELLKYEIRKYQLEPFFHWDIETVRESDYIISTDKQTKEYFNEWCKTKTITDINQPDSIEPLQEDLDKYVSDKEINNTNNNNDE